MSAAPMSSLKAEACLVKVVRRYTRERERYGR